VPSASKNRLWRYGLHPSSRSVAASTTEYTTPESTRKSTVTDCSDSRDFFTRTSTRVIPTNQKVPPGRWSEHPALAEHPFGLGEERVGDDEGHARQNATSSARRRGVLEPRRHESDRLLIRSRQ